MTSDGQQLRDYAGVTPLIGENISSWAEDIESALKIKKVWKTVDPGTGPGQDATDAVKDKWEEDSGLACGTMTLTCSEAIRRDIRAENNRRVAEQQRKMGPQELFNWLKAEYQADSIQARLRIKREIQDAHRTPQASMREHISKLTDLYDQLANVGAPVEEMERCLSLLSNLPAAYNNFVGSYRTIAGWTRLRSDLIEEERRLKAQDARAATTASGSVFAVGQGTQQHQHPPQQQHQHQGGGGGGGGGDAQDGNGHRGGFGWRGRGGFRGRGRGRGGSGGGYGGQGTTNDNSFHGLCNACQQPGHRWRQCPVVHQFVQQQGAASRQATDQAAVAREATTASAPASSPAQEDSSDLDLGWAYMAGNGRVLAVGTGTTKPDTFILDSGASRHITPHRARLHSYRPAAPGTALECANGAMMPILGFGSITAQTDNGETLTLKDVAHCPSAIGNLIGGKRLTQGGCRITLEDDAATVTDAESGEIVMRGEARAGGWTVRMYPVKDLAAAAQDRQPDPAAVSAHSALGHVGPQVLRQAAKAGLMAGIPKKIGDIGFCSACAQGKMPRSPHPRTNGQAQRAMELTHVDIFGPVRAQTESALGGYQYGLVIVDDYSKHVWVKLLRLKSEAPQELKNFHLAMSTRVPHLPISRVRTDGALEFQTADLHDFWLKRGVTHELSPRYAPQSNGVAERNVRTMTEMTRTAIAAAQLPHFFWPAAVQNAAYIKNRVTAAGLSNGKTPHEILFGEPPRKEAFHPFGCVAWAKKTQIEQHGKFDTKARACIYLGRAFTGASRLWDPQAQKELVEHSVLFDDKRMGVELLAAPRPQQHPPQILVGGPSASSGHGPVPAKEPERPALPTPTPELLAARRTIQSALEARAVPADAVETARAIVVGQPLSRTTVMTLIARLQAHARRPALPTGPSNPGSTDAAPSTRTEEQNGRGGAGATDRGSREESAEARRGTTGTAETSSGEGISEGETRGAAGAERRSGRLAGAEPEFGPLAMNKKRKEPGDGEVCFAVVDPAGPTREDPRTVREALSRGDKHDWLAAMHVEVRSHLRRGTWRTVKRHGKPNLVTMKWVFRLKRNADGTIQKHKARLVARGFTQVQGVDFDETFAPTSRLQNLRLLCAMAAALDLDLHQIDYETAYLNAPLKNEIFAEPPDGMDQLGQPFAPDEALELKLALYGLRQSGHEWHRVLREALKSIGFEQCKTDPTMFVRGGKCPAILLVYVDDILVAAPPGGHIDAVKAELLTLFKGTDLGPAHHCLGIRISRDRDAGTITLDQERYAEDVLARFGMGDCKPTRTPMDAKGSLRKAVENEARADAAKYQAIVGSLAYLAQGTRPDLAYAVSVLGRYNADPTDVHLIAAKRVLRYVRGTSKAKLVFGERRQDGSQPGLRVQGFVDADWAADRDDRKSTSGFVFTAAGGAVSWGSRKQGAVALSTAEAEYIAAGVAGREALMLSGALTAAGQEVGTITVHCDNQAAIHLVKNPGSHHDRSKHIDIVHHWIRDKTQEGAFAFQYIPTDVNPADAFTKSLGTHKHHRHAQAIGMALALGTWRHGWNGSEEGDKVAGDGTQ